MATGTVYLDVDDEITSAAARIRGSAATKVALVMPYGSRIATSRMNFRLLSREALVNNRRLSIVASDAATRALAASAGLPVFASVAEWEASPEAGPATPGGTDEDGPASEPAAVSPIVPGPVPPAGSRSRKKAAMPPIDETQTLGLSLASDAAAVAAVSAPAASAPAASVATVPIPTVERASPASAPAATPRPAHETGRVPVAKSRSMPRIGGLAVIIAAVLILVVVVAGVGAYVFLPSAEIVVTPREEGMSIALVVRADPDVTTPDAAQGVVPADQLEVPVSASDTFPASDKRVVDTPAEGRVTFRSVDFTSTNTIPVGSVVSTPSGVRFKTDRTIIVPKARFVDPLVEPAFADVSVTAVKTGPSGNVEPNTITVIPAAESPVTLSVRNQLATTGGTHQEFLRIRQEDLDAATTSLQAQLAEVFSAAVVDGAGAPANVTVFPETAVLGVATPSVDPKTLVGKEQATFDLGLTATGTVTAVDASPVVKIAETRLLATVGADHRLVEGSIKIEPGDPTVSNGEVTFPVTAKASRVRILDRSELLTLVKGQSVEQARTLLAQFGDVKVTPWPDWVSSIPSIDSRVTIEIVGQPDQAGGSAAPSGSTKPTATARPSATGEPPGTSSPSGGASPAAPTAP